MQEFRGAGRPGGKPNRRHRSSGSGVAAAPVSLLGLALMLGAASAIGPDLPAIYKVLHANVVFRHGERTRLVKTVGGASEFGLNDDVVLTNKGEQDCYNLGAQLRERYMPTEAAIAEGVSTTIGGLTLWYDPDRVQIESSGYQRTIESATALAFGLYPAGQTDPDVAQNTLLEDNIIVAPVLSSTPINDPYILGFDKCPVYNQNWIETYEEDGFLLLQEQATAPQVGENGEPKDGFITQVYDLFQLWVGGNSSPVCFEEAKQMAESKLTEHGPYNLWDCAVSADLAGDTTAVDIIEEAGIPPEGAEHLGLDSTAEARFQGFHYLEYLVNEIEDRKYEQRIVGRMAGGLYLTAMHTRMKEVREHFLAGETADTGRLAGMHISAGHFGTLKGIAGALDLGGLEGIPEFTSHLTFELLFNSQAAEVGEDPFGVRILYQEGTRTATLDFQQMGVIFDGSFSASIDDALASARDSEHGIMPWVQWDYLMHHQVAGDPAIYTSEDFEEEWCLDCLAFEPNACLKLELRLTTEKWEEAEIAASQAVDDKEAVDDNVGGTHVALVSVFGLILGIGMGICIKPCIDRTNNKMKSSSSSKTTSGNRGLEAWGSSGSRTNGSFRLGAKAPSTRHMMGAVDAGQMVSVQDSAYGGAAPMNGGTYATANGNDSVYDEEEDVAGASIPSFAPTSSLGEPVPFPHRRQASGMVTGGGVDSSMMTGIDGEDGDDDDITGAPTSRELLEFD